MKLNKTALNIAIILAIAALVDLLPAGGTVADFVFELIAIAFLVVIAWVSSRMYREHRIEIYGLGTQRRTLLYVAIGVAVLTLSASHRLTATPAGSVAFIALLAGAAYTVFAVYRGSREY